MKLIDKDLVVAEIEKLEGKISDSSSYCNGWQHALRMLKLSLDTLETKEIGVDVGSPKGDYCVKVKYKIQKGSMTKQETIQVLQSIEDRAVNLPNMTECDWVAIAAAKRHLENNIAVKGVDLNEEIANQYEANYEEYLTYEEFADIAKHFFELGMQVSNKQQKGE